MRRRWVTVDCISGRHFHREPLGSNDAAAADNSFLASSAEARSMVPCNRVFRDGTVRCRSDNFELYRCTPGHVCVCVCTGATSACAAATIVWGELTEGYENRREKSELRNAFGETNFAWKHDCLRPPRLFLRLPVFTLAEATSRYCPIECRCELYVIK